MQNLGFRDEFVHVGPLIRKEAGYKTLTIQERVRILRRMIAFVSQIDFTYKAIVVEKKHLAGYTDLYEKLARQLSEFIKRYLPYFYSFDKVKIYYDNGQTEIMKIIISVFSTLFNSVEFRKAAQEAEAAGITIDELVAIAKAKSTGQDEQKTYQAAPEIYFVRAGKPGLAPLSIAAAYEEYINHCVIAKNMPPKTIRHWKYMQKLAVVYFSGEANEHTGKHKPINSIQELDYNDALDFQKYLATWLRQDTVRQTMTRLRCVIDWFDARGYNVIKSKFINVPKHEKHEVECLDLQEVREFIDIVAEPHANLSEQGRLRNIAICELLFSSGIRVSEAERLDRDSIKNRMFNVVQGKSKKGRPCFINKRAEKAIKAYLDTRTDHCKVLFISTEADKRLSAQAMRHIFSYTCKISRFVGIHPHTFRHSFATYMLNHGTDLITLARMLGHEDVQTTQLYTHVTDPQLRIVYERIIARV